MAAGRTGPRPVSSAPKLGAVGSASGSGEDQKYRDMIMAEIMYSGPKV